MKFHALFVLTALCLLPGLTASAQETGYYPKGGPDVAAENVSLIQLIANPKAYDQKVVRIVGYLHLEFEGDVLYLHREDFDYGLTENGIWINLPKDITPAQVKAINDRYVICTGRFIAGGQGHMDLNSGEMDNLTRIQIWPFGPKTGAGSGPAK